MNVEVMPAHSAQEIEVCSRRAEEVLRDGGLLVYPTETVYGIGGDGSAQNNSLIARVKGRESQAPLILLIPDLETACQLLKGLEWSELASALAARFWPGPLTLVLPCQSAPRGLVGPGGGVAVRITPHPVARAILARWRWPLTSTSANRAGQVPARTLRDALWIFEDRDDLRGLPLPVLGLDAGQTSDTVPSTILSLVERPPRILRDGPIARDEIGELIPEISSAET